MFETEQKTTWQKVANQTTMSAFLVGLLVGAGSVWIAADAGLVGSTPEAGEETPSDDTDSSATTTPEDDDTSSSDTSASGEMSVVVSDQPAGSSVLLSTVSLSQNGWVAVHEELPNGGLGAILGARRFDIGEHLRKDVLLLRDTEAGSTYHVVVHADDGDSEFNHESETPITDADGAMIKTSFIATGGSSE